MLDGWRWLDYDGPKYVLHKVVLGRRGSLEDRVGATCSQVLLNRRSTEGLYHGVDFSIVVSQPRLGINISCWQACNVAVL